MKQKIRTLIVIVILLIFAFNVSASAQGIKNIMEKLTALEKRIDQIVASRGTEIANLRKELLNVKPVVMKAEKDKSITLLKSNIDEISRRVDEITVNTDLNRNDIKTIKESEESTHGSPVPLELVEDLRGLISELRSTLEEKETEKTPPVPDTSEVEEVETVQETDDTGVDVSAGVDLVSRYVWRGMDFGNNPNIQPSITFSSGGFEAGFWGAYTYSSDASGADENDIWMSYTHEFENSASLSLLLTDYYFPNAGAEFFNFNNHDDPEGPGAHTLEAGLSFTGTESFPVTLSAYLNFHNDPGKNAYYEIGYSSTINGTSVDFFAGAAGGSKDNPGYYGAEDFSIINLGMTTSKDVKITEHFSLPFFFSYVLNPKLELSYLVIGVSF